LRQIESGCAKSLASSFFRRTVFENFFAAVAVVIGFVILTQLTGRDENFSLNAALIARSCAENRKAS
jgi:hypothetical protein